MNKFKNLHTHTEYSLNDSVIRIPQLVKTLKEYKQDHIVRLLEKLDEKKQYELIKQIQGIDLHQIMELYNNTELPILYIFKFGHFAFP